MKKLIILTLIVFTGVIYSQAQSTPGIDQRQRNQRNRIQQGVASGELTRSEAANARQNQRKVQRTERRAKSDGVVTPGERARIHHKQNRASRQLRRDKHDAQDRPGTN